MGSTIEIRFPLKARNLQVQTLPGDDWLADLKYELPRWVKKFEAKESAEGLKIIFERDSSYGFLDRVGKSDVPSRITDDGGVSVVEFSAEDGKKNSSLNLVKGDIGLDISYDPSITTYADQRYRNTY